MGNLWKNLAIYLHRININFQRWQDQPAGKIILQTFIPKLEVLIKKLNFLFIIYLNVLEQFLSFQFALHRMMIHLLLFRLLFYAQKLHFFLSC